MHTKITIDNTGQEFQSFVCNKEGVIIEVEPDPDNSSIWLGSEIPINDYNLMQEGLQCPIRKPNSNGFGYLRQKIKKIKKYE